MKKEAFDEDQLHLIRDTFAEILWYPEQGKRFILETEEDALDVINAIQRMTADPEYKSVDQFRRNTALRWTDEPVMPEEDEEK